MLGHLETLGPDSSGVGVVGVVVGQLGLGLHPLLGLGEGVRVGFDLL